MVGVMEEEEDDTNPLYHGYQQSLARVHQEFRGKHLRATSNVFNLSVVRIPSGPPARDISTIMESSQRVRVRLDPVWDDVQPVTSREYLLKLCCCRICS